MGKIILTASGKGGVGKTTLTANLSACLAERGRSVLCFDADLRLRNLDIVFNLSAAAVFDIGDLFLERCGFAKAVLQHPLHPKLHFIPGPAKPPDNLEGLYRFLSELAAQKAEEYDYVLIDCPSGIGTAMETMVEKGRMVLLVATPDQPSVRDAEKTAELAYAKGAGARLAVNRIRPALIRKGLAPDIDDVIDATAVQLIGIVPESPRVLTSAANGVLLCDTNRTRALAAMENIAARLDGESVPLLKFKKSK